ncbi:TetR/AcrR family transcriptional regulator [Dyella soli]|uniref:TetR/AcrR family transcriptional regulator n=2 Tax=Dyella soli TaxID=522319 RepID=A0A4R0YPC4_9GAMM|nr:TetR/AcrR family transcriptional regulator [Dyella soli]
MSKPSLREAPTPLPARERILRTAHDLFYQEGIRATGIDRVIAEAGVTKVTFYRHFPSKNDLVQAFLEFRHERWMTWFRKALGRHEDKGVDAVVEAMREWFTQPDFRGCAFINTVVELGGTVPAFEETSRHHKEEMTDAIRALLPPDLDGELDASAIALAVDGAIVRMQYTHNADDALRLLSRLLHTLQATAASPTRQV